MYVSAAEDVSDKICTNLCKLPEQRSKINSSVCIFDLFFYTSLKENMIWKHKSLKWCFHI